MDLGEVFRQVKVKSVLLDYRYKRDALFKLNLAYCRMLLEEGFLNEQEYDVIVNGLKQAQVNVKEEDVLNCGGDIYFLYEKALYEAAGAKKSIAAKLHTGRSRNDMYFTMYRMSLRDAIWSVAQEVIDTQRLLEEEAAKHTQTIIPYYTYGQPAQPGTWGHYLLSVHEMFSADLERIRHAYQTVNRCPMGSAAGIGTAFKLNKQKVSDLLGFDSVIDNTMVGNSAVDYFLETIAAFGILNTTLSRVSADFMFFSAAECKVIDFDRSICGVSSIMPQKKNAAAAELLRSLTEHFNGYMVNAFSSASSTSLFPIHETYFFFERFWDNVQILIDNLRLLRLLLERGTVNKEMGYKLALNGFTAATGMAEELTVQTGLPFTVTHDVVGGMIRTLMDNGRLKVENMTGELMAEISRKVCEHPMQKTDQEIRQMLDPLNSLNAKTTGGTPKPNDTLEMLEKERSQTDSDEQWLMKVKKQVSDAYEKLA